MIRQADIEELKRNVDLLQNEGYTKQEAIDLLKVASINDLADAVQGIYDEMQKGFEVNVAHKPYGPLC